VLKVLSLIGAGAAVAVGVGLAIPADAVALHGSSLSTQSLTNELAAINKSPSYQCYLQAEAYTNPNGSTTVPSLPGATTQTWSNGAAADWTYVRTTQLAKVGYIQAHNPTALAAASLDQARVSLANQITDTVESAATASSSTYSCTAAASGQATLASLPTWFVNEQVQAQAATLGLEALVPNVIAESGPGLKAWCDKNAGLFDTTCISLIPVSSITVAQEVQAKIKAGMSIADAFRAYSDGGTTTKGKDGSIGCYAPTSSFWQTIWTDINPLPLGQVSIFSSGSGYVLVGPTKRTPNGFASISVAVASQAHLVNEQATALLAVTVQRTAQVTVDPSIGTWVPTQLGGTIEPPKSPPASSLVNPSANTPPTTTATSTPTQ
jgi:hypothetical protein